MGTEGICIALYIFGKWGQVDCDKFKDRDMAFLSCEPDFLHACTATSLELLSFLSAASRRRGRLDTHLAVCNRVSP